MTTIDLAIEQLEERIDRRSDGPTGPRKAWNLAGLIRVSEVMAKRRSKVDTRIAPGR